MLHIYLDEACTIEFTQDIYNDPVNYNTDLNAEIPLWIKSDNADLTYINLSFIPTGDDAQLDVKLALDNAGVPGTYVDSLTIPDGSFQTPVKIWRKIFFPIVTDAFHRTDIQLNFQYDEYVI